MALSREPGINVQTVAKWHKRETLKDRKTGPTEPRSTVLSSSEEAMSGFSAPYTSAAR